MRVEYGEVVGQNWDCQREDDCAGNCTHGADDEAEISDRRYVAVADCCQCYDTPPAHIAQNPLHTFLRKFPVDGEVANLLPISFRSCQFVTDLLRTCLCCGLVTGKSPTCYGLAAGKLV